MYFYICIINPSITLGVSPSLVCSKVKMTNFSAHTTFTKSNNKSSVVFSNSLVLFNFIQTWRLFDCKKSEIIFFPLKEVGESLNGKHNFTLISREPSVCFKN